MSLANIFQISGSGMSAQTVRLNTIASNIANAESTSSSVDQIYRARQPVFSAVKEMVDANGFRAANFSGEMNSGFGVEVKGVVESAAPLQKRYEPHHPSADEEGYVVYPNVNVVEEMADMISASRSFQTNVEVMNNAKQMMQRLLTLGQ